MVAVSLAMLPGVAASNAALVTFVIYIFAVFVLAWFSNRLLKKRSFLSEYFLGSRSLGLWAFALTFAATGASGGSFTGFPSKIYFHGWILGLWIASYLVYPICTMGFLGKRLNQVARISGAITIPDVLRSRFRSRELGWVAVGLIVFFMAFNLVAQFKSGSEILRTLLRDVPLFHTLSAWVGQGMEGVEALQGVSSDYALCLLVFGVSVIAYTTYGGFHAVVWTDVMQGIVMVIGVMILLPLTLWQVGGLASASRQLAEMTPPHYLLLDVEMEQPLSQPLRAPAAWLLLPGHDGEQANTFRLARIGRDWTIPSGVTTVRHLAAVELTTPSRIAAQLERLEQTGAIASVEAVVTQVARQQRPIWLDARLRDSLAGSRIVVTRTLEYRYGADRAGVYASGPGPTPPILPQSPGTIELSGIESGWTVRVVDLEGGVVVSRNAGGLIEPTSVERIALESGSYRVEVARGDRRWCDRKVELGPGEIVVWDVGTVREWRKGEWSRRREATVLDDGFLPLGLAFSFFFMWAISGTGQPGYMVRLMAFKKTSALRRGIVVVSVYYGLIYFPLVIVFVCARLLLPGMELESDRIMPQMAVTVTGAAGHAWLAGLLIAAPFAAVMSTVDSFLLVISSGLVRDIYQKSLNPHVGDKTVKRLSYACTLVVGVAATLGALNPPRFLQDIIVYTGSGLAACFLAPMVFALYAPRSTRDGALAGMVGGFLAHLSMYLTGWWLNGSFYRPYKLGGLDPVVIGLVVSFLAVWLVSRLTPPPDEWLIRRYFMTPSKK